MSIALIATLSLIYCICVPVSLMYIYFVNAMSFFNSDPLDLFETVPKTILTIILGIVFSPIIILFAVITICYCLYDAFSPETVVINNIPIKYVENKCEKCGCMFDAPEKDREVYIKCVDCRWEIPNENCEDIPCRPPI